MGNNVFLKFLLGNCVLSSYFSDTACQVLTSVGNFKLLMSIFSNELTCNVSGMDVITDSVSRENYSFVILLRKCFNSKTVLGFAITQNSKVKLFQKHHLSFRLKLELYYGYKIQQKKDDVTNRFQEYHVLLERLLRIVCDLVFIEH